MMIDSSLHGFHCYRNCEFYSVPDSEFSLFIQSVLTILYIYNYIIIIIIIFHILAVDRFNIYDYALYITGIISNLCSNNYIVTTSILIIILPYIGYIYVTIHAKRVFLMVFEYFGFHKCLNICNKMIPVTTKLSLSLKRYGKLNLLSPIRNVHKTKI